ncbi:MAG: SDR family oxidoreductase [Flammeovirgaceae bacterium]|nr:SDR family oxidoreductase [Flammeovirgaceae bacterium]
MKKFSEKVVIITGSSMGIGKAVAKLMGGYKAKIILNARNEEKLIATKEELSQFGYEVESFQGDVSSEGDCKKLIVGTIEKFGKIDVLINNAGMSMRGMVEDVTPAVMNSIFQINALGPFMLSQMALPHIKKTKGSIVFISSLAGFRGLPFISVYSSAKMSLTALADSLRVEHHDDKIHIGIVYVGYTEIERGKTTLGADGSPISLDERTGYFNHSIDDVAKRIVRSISSRKKKTVIGVAGRMYAILTKYFPWITEQLVIRSHRKMKKIYK